MWSNHYPIISCSIFFIRNWNLVAILIIHTAFWKLVTVMFLQITCTVTNGQINAVLNLTFGRRHGSQTKLFSFSIFLKPMFWLFIFPYLFVELWKVIFKNIYWGTVRVFERQNQSYDSRKFCISIAEFLTNINKQPQSFSYSTSESEVSCGHCIWDCLWQLGKYNFVNVPGIETDTNGQGIPV